APSSPWLWSGRERISSWPDKRNFYIIARGSIYECISVLDILKEINVIDDNKYDELYKIGENITKMLIGLISSLVTNK
ncbi:MAG: four helix bundle protein, partial [Candidatus Absconditabacteria bacterium]